MSSIPLNGVYIWYLECSIATQSCSTDEYQKLKFHWKHLRFGANSNFVVVAAISISISRFSIGRLMPPTGAAYSYAILCIPLELILERTISWPVWLKSICKIGENCSSHCVFRWVFLCASDLRKFRFTSESPRIIYVCLCMCLWKLVSSAFKLQS